MGVKQANAYVNQCIAEEGQDYKISFYVLKLFLDKLAEPDDEVKTIKKCSWKLCSHCQFFNKCEEKIDWQEITELIDEIEEYIIYKSDGQMENVDETRNKIRKLRELLGLKGE